MSIKYIDGIRLKNAIIAGAQSVFQMREHLNKINFFPIPDKDTGTNLSVTLREVVRQMERKTSPSVHEASLTLAEAALLGAQGNSGAVFAQFFLKLAEGLAGKIRVTTHSFSPAVENAANRVYEAIASPVDGTILTVIYDWAMEIQRSCQVSQDFIIVLRNALNQARLSLAATKDKIAILRKKGVVDAGAQGFVSLLEGITEFIERGKIRNINQQNTRDFETLSFNPIHDFQAEIAHQFCVECLLVTRQANKSAIQQLLKDKGESLAIAASKRLMRVHLHTNQPEAIREILTDWGEIKSFQVKDLIKQQSEAMEFQQETKIALVTDSSCDLPHELVTKYHINIVPVRIHFGNESYLDKQTITPLEFYEKLKSSPIHPTTSQPTPANFKEVYENLAKRYESILSIHLSGSLSGTFRAAQTAAKLIHNTQMMLIDSKTTSIALGMLLVEAGEAIAERLPVHNIAEKLEDLVKKIKIIIQMPSLKYLMRGGRIKRSKGLIATILNIKPLLTFGPEGTIKECGKAFTNYFAIRKTVKKVKTDLQNLKNARIGIVHANAIAKAEWLRQQFANLPSVKEIIIHDVAPVLGVHAGPGTVGVAYWGEK